MEIGGRALQKGAWRLLTPETRQQVRAWLDQPVVSRETLELRGRVRAVDLDMRRFDLRRVPFPAAMITTARFFVPLFIVGFTVAAPAYRFPHLARRDLASES